MKDTIHTLCIPIGEFIFFGDMREGKFLKNSLLSGGPDQVFQEAKKLGFRGKHLVIAALFPDFRQITFTFPEMEREDLPEAIYWDKDRLFRTEEPIVMDWRVLRHDPSGFKILGASCREKEFRPWRKAAQKKGWTISRMISVPETAVKEGENAVILLCGKTEATAYKWDGKDWLPTSRIRLDDKDHLAALQKFNAPASILWFPLTSCTSAECEAWQKFLRNGEGVWSPKEQAFMLARFMENRGKMNLAFPEDRPKPFWSKDMKWLRICQGITVLSAAAFLYTALWFGLSLEIRKEEEERAGHFAPIMAEMASRKKEEQKIAEVRQEVRRFTEQDPHWLGRLVVLADAAPPGIVLRRVETAGKDLVFNGTARNSAVLSLYQQRLRSAWKIQGRADVQHSALPYYEFTLRFSLKDHRL